MPPPDARPEASPSKSAAETGSESSHDGATAAPPAERAVVDDRRLIFYGLLTGLCPLIPAPFVDDWVRDRIRRRLVDELASHHAPTLGADERSHLARGPSQSLSGCIAGCATGAPIRLTVYVVSRIFRSTFRKIFIFLAFKDAADTFSRTLHEGHLLRHAFEQGWMTGQPDNTVRMRQALVDACDDVDTGAIQRVARGVMTSSRRLFRQGARQLARSRFAKRQRGANTAETLVREEALLGDMIDDMTVELDRTIANQPGHWSNLRRAFEERLSVPDAHPVGSEPPSTDP